MISKSEITSIPFQMTGRNHELLKTWLNGYLLDESELVNLPKLGLMVSHCNAPVGVAFLRTIEGGKGLIDGFLADPKCEPSIKTKCLDRLILDLIELAKFNDMTGIIGLTTNKKVITRASKLGFSLMDHTLLSLKCSTWNNLGDDS
jgi:hypothetical protein